MLFRSRIRPGSVYPLRFGVRALQASTSVPVLFTVCGVFRGKGLGVVYTWSDNAESNDTCLKTLTSWFPIDVGRCRLRCIGHIINLVVRAVIFGSNASRLATVRSGPDRGLICRPLKKTGPYGLDN